MISRGKIPFTWGQFRELVGHLPLNLYVEKGPAEKREITERKHIFKH